MSQQIVALPQINQHTWKQVTHLVRPRSRPDVLGDVDLDLGLEASRDELDISMSFREVVGHHLETILELLKNDSSLFTERSSPYVQYNHPGGR